MGKVKGDYAKRSGDRGDDFKSGASGEITAANYSERAIAFIRGCGGNGFVIRAFEGGKGSLATRIPATEPQWIAWIKYFRSKEIPQAFTISRGMATVPCEWPEMFDYAAPISNREARLKRRPAPESAECRAEIQRRFEELGKRIVVRGWDVMVGRPAEPFNVGNLSPAMAEAHLATLTAQNAKGDLKLSSLGLKSLGISLPDAPEQEGAA